MDVVVTENLTKTYKNGRGIKNLSITVRKGQVFGLLGPNGCGKTTTMKLMAGILHPGNGTVTVYGESPGDNMEKAMRSVGCLIESPSFYPYLTARQNLELIRKLYPDCPKERTETVLEQVGLAYAANDKSSKFSLGMKQRLGLALALISEPELLILDEPSNGLDIEGIAGVRKIIQEHAASGTTIIISSHLAAELEQICTDVAMIRDGTLIGIADVSGVLKEFGSIENYYLTLIKEGRQIL